jgi:hypothetical protein
MRIRYLGDYADADSEHQAAPLAPGAPSSPEDEESPEEQQTNLGNLETPEAETEATPVLHEPLADEPVPEGENQRNMEIVGARVIGGWMELVRKAYTSAKGDAEKEAAKCNQLIQAIAKLIERSDDSNLSGVINMMISLRAHASGACDLLGGRQCAVETRGRLLRRGIPVPGIIDEIIAYRAE